MLMQSTGNLAWLPAMVTQRPRIWGHRMAGGVVVLGGRITGEKTASMIATKPRGRGVVHSRTTRPSRQAQAAITVSWR